MAIVRTIIRIGLGKCGAGIATCGLCDCKLDLSKEEAFISAELVLCESCMEDVEAENEETDDPDDTDDTDESSPIGDDEADI